MTLCFESHCENFQVVSFHEFNLFHCSFIVIELNNFADCFCHDKEFEMTFIKKIDSELMSEKVFHNHIKDDTVDLFSMILDEI